MKFGEKPKQFTLFCIGVGEYDDYYELWFASDVAVTPELFLDDLRSNLEKAFKILWKLEKENVVTGLSAWSKSDLLNVAAMLAGYRPLKLVDHAYIQLSEGPHIEPKAEDFDRLEVEYDDLNIIPVSDFLSLERQLGEIARDVSNNPNRFAVRMLHPRVLYEILKDLFDDLEPEVSDESADHK